MTHQRAIELRPSATQRVAIGIEDLLHWAFAREFAQLDLSGGGDGLAMAGYGYASATAGIIQHEQLGCRVDGGGRSDPHPDADVVADALAVLPVTKGGAPMAVMIAEHARAGTRPDPMVGAKPRCVPVEWTRTGGVRRSKTQFVATYVEVIRGKRSEKEVRCCPVTYDPSPSTVAFARRRYLSWWGALLDIRQSFQLCGGLSCWDLTDDMPPRAPWSQIDA